MGKKPHPSWDMRPAPPTRLDKYIELEIDYV